MDEVTRQPNSIRDMSQVSPRLILAAMIVDLVVNWQARIVAEYVGIIAITFATGSSWSRRLETSSQRSVVAACLPS
ncbi:MAG TPA: hypothetical protein VMW65_07335 [Chloroflexota bacterium]|nr:hypothetical protein [Chloroflexota bacterium]